MTGRNLVVGVWALLIAPLALAKAATDQVGVVFVIAFENHNLTQPYRPWGEKPILGNKAAPYMNSLMTPGNPNAAETAYARAYYNVGVDNGSIPNNTVVPYS